MSNHSPELRTHVQPVSEYLRLISTNTAEAAVNARQRLSSGEFFYQVARDTSVDRTAAIGGFLGRRALAELSGELSSQASRLAYGETSPVFENGSHWIILERLPRDFRWDAEQLQQQAEDLALHGDAAGAIEQAQKALMIYPQFLRAINFIRSDLCTEWQSTQSGGGVRHRRASLSGRCENRIRPRFGASPDGRQRGSEQSVPARDPVGRRLHCRVYEPRYDFVFFR